MRVSFLSDICADVFLSDICADVLLVRFGSWCRYVACVQTGHGNSEDVVDSSSDVVNFFEQA